MTVLRWYVARIHQRHTPRETLLDVVIIRANKNLAYLARAKIDEVVDELDWWEPEEGMSLEGWLNEEQLILSIREGSPRHDEISKSQPRRITEDMVFLQFAVDNDELDRIWTGLMAENGLPSVEMLADLKGSQWVDFTVPARRSAKSLYLNLLGELPLEQGPFPEINRWFVEGAAELGKELESGGEHEAQ